MKITHQTLGRAPQDTPVTTYMEYDKEDPLALTFSYAGSKETWAFSRDLLAEAISKPGVICGLGDVMFHVNQDTVAMTFGTERLRMTITYPLLGMELFLAETITMVPVGEEIVDFSDDFAAWFEDQPGV